MPRKLRDESAVTRAQLQVANLRSKVGLAVRPLAGARVSEQFVRGRFDGILQRHYSTFLKEERSR